MNKKHREKAAYFDKGLVSKKGVYFHTPSDFAKQNLFCLAWGGEFVCDASYEINRQKKEQFFDNYLIFRILEGSLNFEYENSRFTAFPGDIIYLDSNIPNHYWASGKVRFQYFHFNGPLAKSFYELLHTQQGICFTGKSESAFLFNSILKEMAQPNASDQKLSLLMYNLIAGLAIPSSKYANENILRAQQYINDNFYKPITVDDIADYASLSRYHFSRIFKKDTGFSPHQYLINVRLRHARELLSSDSASLDTIAMTCGFSSTSHFISVFKKETGVTPVMFKKFFDMSGFS
ncbi:AraC family transcriptional regulator [Lawsonibacter sp. OA9]|uniref:AraC family transcriptional regulator n=1 Tax=Oscillospiraceae TaxID=216572 RepID=UPI001F06803C|nr:MULTISPECIES: AraC family transcriptional regulator [Oscillospiraceae]MCH1978147.1 AraC family transcriptional regulator [Lawsonibacter sp. OA9]MCH1982071.1 AraC family transcriptional regulator [Ruminococcus sp. OA3]